MTKIVIFAAGANGLPPTDRSVVQEVNRDSTGLLRAGAIGLALLWLYGGVLGRLIQDWWVDDNYSHGFLIPFISGYIIWTNRDRLLTLADQPRRLAGSVTMLAAVLLLVAGLVGAIYYVSRVSFVVALAGLTLYFGGWRHLRLLAFPIGLFLLAIPIPTTIFNRIAFPLQLIASDYATWAIRQFGIPALREGNVIELASMKLQVVEACSGIRSLMTLTTLAVTWAYFTEKKWWRRIAIVAAVVPVAIIANAARVAGTGLMANRWGPEAAEGFMHGFSGWLIFVVALLLIMAISRLMNFAERLFRRRRVQSV
ncbi:MAG TPA: exosortase A [Blastocatellia bacterium]|nr:exosortase A [Blastocatellia bacterium]